MNQARADRQQSSTKRRQRARLPGSPVPRSQPRQRHRTIIIRDRQFVDSGHRLAEDRSNAAETC
jgi:hypothetical protein